MMITANALLHLCVRDVHQTCSQMILQARLSHLSRLLQVFLELLARQSKVFCRPDTSQILAGRHRVKATANLCDGFRLSDAVHALPKEVPP